MQKFEKPEKIANKNSQKRMNYAKNSVKVQIEFYRYEEDLGNFLEQQSEINNCSKARYIKDLLIQEAIKQGIYKKENKE